MLKKLRRSSGHVTLVLIGAAALGGCASEKRDVYATKQDCLADWANSPKDCEPATSGRHAASGFWYGPMMVAGSGFSRWNRGTGFSPRSAGPSRSIGSTGSSGSSTRGGFGSSGRASSSGG